LPLHPKTVNLTTEETMQAFEGQVLVLDRATGKKEWKSVACTGRNGYVYRYNTYNGAHNMLETCYPGLMFREEKRVVQVNKAPNMRD